MNEDSPLRKSSKPLNLPAEFQEKNPLALFKKIHDTVGEKYLFGSIGNGTSTIFPDF